ncbi:hypothetical protein BGZ73_002098 [Actinomortierella ambigua]|nr:hypothetical protein BGZ73_002098 [Actinomortierella ambigua]
MTRPNGEDGPVRELGGTPPTIATSESAMRQTVFDDTTMTTTPTTASETTNLTSVTPSMVADIDPDSIHLLASISQESVQKDGTSIATTTSIFSASMSPHDASTRPSPLQRKVAGNSTTSSSSGSSNNVTEGVEAIVSATLSAAAAEASSLSPPLASTPHVDSSSSLSVMVATPTIIETVTTTTTTASTSSAPTRPQPQSRPLHYESANKVLVPPLNFAMVAPGVYRSGHPNKHNFPFLKKLGLKVIVQMSEEEYAPDLQEFLRSEGIREIHYKIEGNKEPFVEIDEKVISSALGNILDSRNHPLLIHCAKGKHRIGCLIGCLRKIQNWSMTSIFDEYRRFAGSKVLADQEFIEVFSAKVQYDVNFKPTWL